MSGTTFATFGTFLNLSNATTTITANGSPNTISAGNFGLANTASILTLNTPLSTDALTVSSALGATSALAGAVSKSGLGTATLPGAGNYTGGTTLTAGTIVVKNANAFGTGASALKLNGGTLDIQTGGTAYPTTVGGTTTIQSDNTASGAGTTKTLGTLSIGAFTLNVAPGANATGSNRKPKLDDFGLSGAVGFLGIAACLLYSGRLGRQLRRSCSWPL